MNSEIRDVEVARSTGHTTAADSPVVAPGWMDPALNPPARQTVEALAFQLAQTMFDEWPCGEFPLDRMTCQLIRSFAWTQALTIHRFSD